MEGDLSMCKYCDRKELEGDTITSIIVDGFCLFGDTFMEIDTSLGLNKDGEIEEEIYLSNTCIASIKINYCPMCGRKLNEE